MNDEVVVRPLGKPSDLGWVTMAHGEIYSTEFGRDATFEAVVARIVADYGSNVAREREAAWIAELDGRRVGCIFCVAADDTTAQLRLLLVHPDARGNGLGGRLVDTCIDFARAAEYERMRLWTNDPWSPGGSTSSVDSCSPRSNRSTVSASASSVRRTSSTSRGASYARLRRMISSSLAQVRPSSAETKPCHRTRSSVISENVQR